MGSFRERGTGEPALAKTNESKTVVVTGVTRGLGLAMAAGLIEAGHTVVGCGRNQPQVSRLQKRWSKPHRFDVVDVADDAAVKEWAQSVLDHSNVDLLVNNAAVINRNAPLWKVPLEEFDTVIDVNIKGVANVIRHFVPAMIVRGSGVIVNFSSGWGRSTSPEVAPYCATKWAIEGLTQALAQELPSGLAAMALNPGIIDTDMLRSCFSGSAGNYPSAEDWAKRAVPFLLGLNRRNNGEALTVPGRS
jgi:NAD(P)-dependent dehydrogenase (short-subunit alcohol dehydrogenase family)